MKTRFFFLVIPLVIGLAGNPLYGQLRSGKMYSLPFHPTTIPGFGSGPAVLRLPGNTTYAKRIPESAFVHGKPYEAFFCKLEVKTEEFLGFGFQIHAGDYNWFLRGEGSW